MLLTILSIYDKFFSNGEHEKEDNEANSGGRLGSKNPMICVSVQK